MRETMGRLLAVAAITGSLAGLTSGAATADQPVTPKPSDIVGVGAQTTGPLFNELSTGYNGFLTGNGDTTSPRLYSFDSTGSATIVPNQGAQPIGRPTGANSGLSALNAIPSDIDFVRTDRAPQVGDPASNLFVAFAKDAVSWAAKDGGNAPPNLTTAQLKGIYNCTITNWQQIDPALPNATIKPYLPDAGSGTRSFFLNAIGLQLWSLCVTTGPSENQGVDPQLNDPNAVFPYSVGHYIGQVYYGHSTPQDSAGPLTIRNINGVAPVSPGTNTTNYAFAATAFGRVLYNVVRQAEWTATSTQGTALRAIFGSSGYICAKAGPVVRSYGFLTLPSVACGSTTHS
ncbi:PstS family phosphate ABC transporter substrate-binding protein [Kitasatospora sp. NBC_00458]|uniref:PstS family phosphate ABC transporter substrate-binding protein n=1 Tax=Kitasatospora sp. NBC_00458 TaxID=2903568 RepID=UPI002E197D72